MKSPKTILFAAPASGAGKTVITLGLLRWLSQQGLQARGAKSGPDYIDPMLHEAACGRPSVNLDAWAMSPTFLHDLATGNNGSNHQGEWQDYLIVEGAMGMMDGAGLKGLGSSSDLAEQLKIPLIVIVDVAKLSQSAILPILGLMVARPNIKVAGMIANRVASSRHCHHIRSAAERYGIKFLGGLKRRSDLVMPSRHLGLLPAQEQIGFDDFLDKAADAVALDLDIDSILQAAEQSMTAKPNRHSLGHIPPLGQRISVARDEAFCFIYPHLLSDWHRAGVEVQFFSPLAGEAPHKDSNAVFLPGGYPELHAPKIAAATTFHNVMREMAQRGTVIYGECGGYMVLGKGLEDKKGTHHAMLGLLGHSTSFKNPQLHLGYRQLTAHQGAPFVGKFRGHEFHYASLLTSGQDQPLFEVHDADNCPSPDIGGVRKSVSGSFAHLICGDSASPN